jgi:hypothetical protein
VKQRSDVDGEKRPVLFRRVGRCGSDCNVPLGGTDSLMEGMRSTKDGSGACWGGGGGSIFRRLGGV